ncbi:hypothetical protein NE237_005868 [Protea cynaroides]|uniref:Uncharacterized protein n=1 Tax=Protea cynaroides TaxID=273540 RepID=A0A9Q0KLI4_9MAGN|nr:hypothetical protein NE237_005868 [Protea cynaroides]
MSSVNGYLLRIVLPLLDSRQHRPAQSCQQDKAKEGAKQAKDLVEEGLDKAKGFIDTAKLVGENLAENVKQLEEKAEDVIDRVKTNVHHLKEEGKENLTDIHRRGREVGRDVLRNAILWFSPTWAHQRQWKRISELTNGCHGGDHCDGVPAGFTGTKPVSAEEFS